MTHVYIHFFDTGTTERKKEEAAYMLFLDLLREFKLEGNYLQIHKYHILDIQAYVYLVYSR